MSPVLPLARRSTAIIEARIAEVREQYVIVIMTYNAQQAQRVPRRTAFFYEGEIIEVGSANGHLRCRMIQAR